jgi:hypothetical protein
VGILDRIPGERREQLAFRIETWLARLAPRPTERVDAPTMERLRDFYAADGAKLEALLQREVPWLRRGG